MNIKGRLRGRCSITHILYDVKILDITPFSKLSIIFVSCHLDQKKQIDRVSVCFFFFCICRTWTSGRLWALKKHSGEVFLAKRGESGTEFDCKLGGRAGKCEQSETFRKSCHLDQKEKTVLRSFLFGRNDVCPIGQMILASPMMLACANDVCYAHNTCKHRFIVASIATASFRLLPIHHRCFAPTSLLFGFCQSAARSDYYSFSLLFSASRSIFHCNTRRGMVYSCLQQYAKREKKG